MNLRFPIVSPEFIAPTPLPSLDLEIKTNYAIAYNNVEIKDDNSVMKAQVVRLNILTKDQKNKNLGESQLMSRY